MKPRTVRRLCLVDGMNLDHIEGWLESMAARGLHYDHSDAFLFHFRRGEPAAVRYRLEPRGTLDCPEGMEHCRTLGWELTGYMGKGFSLFRTWEPDAPELHTDPVVRGYGLDKLARLVRWFATPMLICALVILALPLWLLLAWDEPVLSLVTGSGDNLFLCILSEWIAIYMSFRSFSSFFALRRRLRERNPGAPAGGVPPASTPPVWPAPLSWWPSALPSWQPGVACAGRGRLRP